MDGLWFAAHGVSFAIVMWHPWSQPSCFVILFSLTPFSLAFDHLRLLDFYGNFFDPRTTGISVRTRQYFFRSHDAHHSPPTFEDAQSWGSPQQNQFQELTKRNSFSSKPHRFQQHLQRQYSFQNTQTNIKTGKFDPIWVEDPLNSGNNVGRNAFRIFQVQRAFSDAHRALVASLEWDINSMHEFGDDTEYPLLKCLLQNEDVFIDG